MTLTYYNEIDRFCCDWLSNLMDANLITPGKIDDRSIVDVRPDDLARFERVHFFAGIGGWDYALRLAGWPVGRPVWTGSCPCQPFSLVGKQKGFDDERHLWPVWRDLIRERRPAKVFGEQVASATEWLGLVRSDLEALGYAVGAIPIQAASAGADHLRDRYWFVADDGGGRRLGPYWREGEQPRRAEAIGASDVILADASSQRSPAGISGSIQGEEGVAGIVDDRGYEISLADAESERGGWRTTDTEGSTGRHGAEVDGCHMGDAGGAGAGRNCGSIAGAEAQRGSGREVDGDLREPAILAGAALDWVIGADGKARRVKSGIRLLAHGVPNRVGLLRGFGNAIDPRCAAEFISAANEAVK
jgi:DNA (cytosine-5)-methyltransferase 1